MNVNTAQAPPPPPLATPGPAPAPGYELLAHLSRTGWLDIYDAWSLERECRCVVKLLRPDRRHEPRLRRRLLREGRWLQEFTHPHLVRAYDTIEEPEPLVVLETLTGETLSFLIHRLRHRPAATDVAFLGLHLCSALHYLHGRGLLHLDIKPANVVVECHRAKVLDLSVAHAPGPVPAGTGTFGYLAPEQARGGTVTAAADVWGTGVTLYEAATGAVPFDCGETASSANASGNDDWYPQLEVRAPPVRARRRLPPALGQAIDRCLEPEPQARPSATELAEILDTLLPRSRRNPSPEVLRNRDMQHMGVPLEHLPDDALLEGLTTGDPELAVSFVRRFQHRIFGVAITVTGDPQLAEDVAQQTFERAWRHAQMYDPRRGSVRGWLTAIARNLAIDAARARRAVPVDPGELSLLLDEVTHTPERQALADETSAELRVAVARLPREQARALVMAGIYGMTAQQVADAEHVPLGTAKSRIRAGMGKLRAVLASRNTQNGSEP
jgi:eukaryotic-like serine/threonine-protein kinase